MSGREPPARPSIEGFVTETELSEELNFIEWLQSKASPQDEYLAAVLENQRLLAMMMLQQMNTQQGRWRPVSSIQLAADGTPEGYNVDVRPVPDSELNDSTMVPLDSVGISNGTIYENDIGSATFQVQGTVFETTIRATEDIGVGDPLVVVAPGNICEPAQDVALSLLGYDGSVGVGSYERAETQGKVDIAPGETETVLEVSVQNAAWVSVGTNSLPYSEYQYRVDGEELLDEPLAEPLGLYNDPFVFPESIAADRKIEVEVTRESGASSSEEYFSKLDYFQ